MNPYVQAGMYGLNSLAQLFAPESSQEKMAKWKLGELPGLFNQFKGQLAKQGDVIDPARMSSLMALFSQQMKPGRDRMAGQFSRLGLRSPEVVKAMGSEYGAQDAGYAGQLGQMNVQMTEQAKQNLMRLLAGMVG